MNIKEINICKKCHDLNVLYDDDSVIKCSCIDRSDVEFIKRTLISLEEFKKMYYKKNFFYRIKNFIKKIIRGIV